MLNILELCLKIMLYNRKFIHLQCVFHSIRLRLRLTKIGCRETINFFFCLFVISYCLIAPLLLTVIKTLNYFLTSSSLRATSPVFCITKHPVRLRDTAGRHRGRGLEVAFQFRYKDTLCTPPLCFALQNIGEEYESRRG